MNRQRTVENYRTVTEITDAENVYHKKFDVSDLMDKNEAYLRETEKREMYLMISKYIAMFIDKLNVPDLKLVFSRPENVNDMLSVVYNSLAFVNNQVFPHSNSFVDMKFVIVNDRKMCIPGEPIVFYRNINVDEDQTVICYVDRPAILRILEKPVDVNIVFEEEDCKSQIMSKLLDRIKCIEQQKCMSMPEFAYNVNKMSYKMDEGYVTQFVVLLIIFTNAYLGYYKLLRTDFTQYLEFLLNHETLERENFMTNLKNLFTSFFKFTAEAEYDKRQTNTFVVKRFD
ncbi:odv-ec27 [Spodoptera litura granulovirus]|uniref:Odv-ec27 n=1 Tax=Spodoptera litura granulovirus TaxID=359919 RepID=A5IZU0_9BBAC|nr:odv-ec27 [Spodoptera litura granulovirus]ABQ52031.1 odv-ec27 [Spodoptera litura granulovirus]